MTKEKFSYDAAVREIGEILDSIESGSLGMDDLTRQVSRATTLLKRCRDQLYRTEEKIGDILDEKGEPQTEA
jgi:exodeoxyribonuclease VII small subunit